jgi:hypothetical protein
MPLIVVGKGASDKNATMRDSMTSESAIGWIDEPRDEGIVGPRVRITGWALAAQGIARVEARIDGHAVRARYGLPRHDVAAVRPGYPDNPYGGFEIVGDFSPYAAPPRIVRRTLVIVVIAADGGETELGRRTLVEPSVHDRWRFLANRPSEPFFLVPALSGVAAGGAYGLETWYSAYTSATTRIGMRVPILPLRATRGAAGDWDFDPDFDVSRRHGTRSVVDDALSHVLEHARDARIPVLVTLNAGIWADASGTCPQWDVIDRLEEDPVNCQWNERDEVMPDDWLAHLPGSQSSPELARALTLNVYAHDVRRYKKRNVQAAASRIAQFMRAHADLVVGVNLDPDVYINPFFAEAQWYDYNPGTLAQFRDWLRGSGPYAGDVGAAFPDLSGLARDPPLALDGVRALACRPFASWDDVDPPRAFSRDPAHPYWRDPWVREWETFRRHLVALHYDELARWVTDAGIPGDRVWSSQGLMAPADDAMPLALSITSPVKNHDSGGVSIAGSKPRGAHLGAIVYGAAAANTMPMENGRTLYATLASLDPGFALVEFNTADLRDPARQPTYADAYRALRDAWNAGARFVSPMAWNGANGLHAGEPGYVSYTAWRNTPLEAAARDFLLARSGLPRGSRLWTFGTQMHADDDGWRIERGTMKRLRGALSLTPDGEGAIVLGSPSDLALAAPALTMVVGVSEDADVRMIAIDARAASDAPWRALARVDGDRAMRTAAGRVLQCDAPRDDGPIDALRVTLVASGAAVTLERVAVLCAS